MTKMSRIHLVMPDESINRLNRNLQYGIRSEVCRQVLDIFMDAVDEYGPGIIGLVLSGDLILVPKPSTRQNLTVSKKS